MVGWDQVRSTRESSTTDCVIDRLDVEFKRADDGSLLNVAEVLVALVHHLAAHSFVRMRARGHLWRMRSE